MTTPDPKATPPATAPPADGEAGRIATIDEKIAAVKDEILGEVRKLVGGAQARERGHLTDPDQSRVARAEQAGKSLDEMIADALKVQDEQRAREAAEKTRDDKIAALEAAGAEKTPVQRGRLHRVMGWGEPPQ